MQTVPPEEIYEATKKMLNLYPQKRFIVHFLQPHMPYIGEVKLPQSIDQNYKYKLVRDAYKSNLKLALEFVRELIEEVEGNVVITSDHGESNLALIMRGACHPCGVNFPELVIVPWFEVDRTHHVRKHVKFASRDVGRKEEKETRTQEEEERVKQRLKALGYL